MCILNNNYCPPFLQATLPKIMKMRILLNVISTVALLVTMATICRSGNVQRLQIEESGQELIIDCTASVAPSNDTRCIHWLLPHSSDIIPCNYKHTSMYMSNNGLSIQIKHANNSNVGDYVCMSELDGEVTYSRTTVFNNIPTVWERYQNQFLAAIISAAVALVILIALCTLIHCCCGGPHKKESIDITMPTFEQAESHNSYRKRQSAA